MLSILKQKKNLSKRTWEFGSCQTAKNSRLFSSCSVWSVYCCVFPLSCPLITHKHMCVCCMCVFMNLFYLPAVGTMVAKLKPFEVWSELCRLQLCVKCFTNTRRRTTTHSVQQRVFTLNKSSKFTIKMRLRLKGKERKQTKSISIQFFWWVWITQSSSLSAGHTFQHYQGVNLISFLKQQKAHFRTDPLSLENTWTNTVLGAIYIMRTLVYY